MSSSSSALENWVREWWQSLGGVVQFLFGIIAIINVCGSIYLGLSHYFSQKMKRAFLSHAGVAQWEVRYPFYIYINQTRPLEVYRVEASSPTSMPNEKLILSIQPPLLRLLDTDNVIRRAQAIEIRLSQEELPVEIQVKNEGVEEYWFYPVIKLQIYANRTKDAKRQSNSISLYMESPLGALLRKVAQAALPVLFGASVTGAVWSSLRHYQKTREQGALADFENLRESFRIWEKFPEDFQKRVERLRPFETVLPAGEYRCLTTLYAIYEAWRTSPPAEPLEKEYQLIQSCSMEWIEALLLLWEIHWEERVDSEDRPWDQYRLLLRQLPRFQLSDAGTQRVKRLLLMTDAPQIETPAKWPPLAGEPCDEHLPVRVAHAPCKTSAYANKISHRATSTSLFPEGEALDARLPQTQAWLFGAECSLFWEHPLLVGWRREASKTQAVAQIVRFVAGKRGSGRTTLALAVGRYLHGEDILGIYVDTPRHLQDIQHALARRLLTFLRVRAPDAWRLERGLREALLHLWLSIWPKAVVRALLERSVEAWDNRIDKATGNNSTSLPIPDMARVELRTWLRMLDDFEQPAPLSPEAWWQLAAEVVPAIGHQIQHPLRRMWIAIDLDETAARRDFGLDAWQSTIAPLARQIPTTWFVFQPSEVALSPTLFPEPLTWSKEDLSHMLRHRLRRLNYSRKKWPDNEQLQTLLTQSTTPRALGRRWLEYEQRIRDSTPNSSQLPGGEVLHANRGA